MTELVFEVLCEEIPARMQANAESALKKGFETHLKNAGLSLTAIGSFSGPRRLCVWVQGLPAKSADKIEEKKGPKVGAPEAAVNGFLRGANLSDISQAQIVEDPKKGPFYIARRTVPGRATTDIIAEFIPEILTAFAWPKSMKSGTRQERWVRPINRLLCIWDGDVIPFEWAGITSGNITEGHRFFGRGPYTITSLADYISQLEGKGHVRLDKNDRKNYIQKEAEAICQTAGLHLVPDPKLVEELAGLVEWPVVLLGAMDAAFLDLPDEVIQLSMRTHQKYLSVRDASNTKLAPNFVVVANIPASDDGAKIKAGNARVLSARLNDAQFFWDQDIATGLDGMAEKLTAITFKSELGSMADKVTRIGQLAAALGEYIPANAHDVASATRLMKNDLVAQMVYEFPELQGTMGGYYARASGESGTVADAIAEHYSPQGPSDSVPRAPTSIICALADKLDTLAGFWAINQKPTGSKDPFALRRAALGVVRLLLENDIRLPLTVAIDKALEIHGLADTPPNCTNDLLSFFTDRLAQHLKSDGIGHDRITAVFAGGLDDITDMAKRAHALESFLQTDDGRNLLAGYKRANNILSSETDKSPRPPINQALFAAPVETELFTALEALQNTLPAKLHGEDYDGALKSVSQLRGKLDSFFDDVIVNDDNSDIRSNRFALLSGVVNVTTKIADFAKIQD